MAKAHQAIKIVSLRTGLSPHVIRIWEKRYKAVEPERTGSNRRVYSEENIERLSLLRAVTLAGHSIGRVAQLPIEELHRLAKSSAADRPGQAASRPHLEKLPYLEESLDAVRALDQDALEEALQRAATAVGNQGLLQRVIAPLVQAIGDLWRDGTITAAHEHFASAGIRVFLSRASRPFPQGDAGPVLVVATPSGQLHELGALLAAATATNLGWKVTYLGASLPAPEIAGAARQNHARAVALSLVYPEDDTRLEGELCRLRELLPPEIPLLVGGRAMVAYGEVLERLGAQGFTDLAHFGAVLDELRKPSRGA